MKALLKFLFVLLIFPATAQEIWEPINFPDSLCPCAINAEKEGILFVASGGNNEFKGLFRSFNDGLDWKLLQVDSLYPYTSIHSIRYNNEGILFLGTNRGIYRSYDDGDSFESIFHIGNNIINIDFSPTNEVFALGWSIILRSSNNGDSWDTLFQEPHNRLFYDIDFGLNGELYVVGGSYDFSASGFFRSLDNGLTWENIGIKEDFMESISVNKTGRIIIGGDIGVYTSDDQGENWTQVSSITANVMESDTNDNLFAGAYINTNTGCWNSKDWGMTWNNMLTPSLNPSVNQFSFSPSNRVYVQCEKHYLFEQQIFRSIDPLLDQKNAVPTNEIKVFPNPVRKHLSILNEGSTKINRFVIYNQNGQISASGIPFNNELDLSHLKPGLYIIRLELEGEMVSKKIMVE
jgi:Secretion system C-terminal sorting domain